MCIIDNDSVHTSLSRSLNRLSTPPPKATANPIRKIRDLYRSTKHKSGTVCEIR